MASAASTSSPATSPAGAHDDTSLLWGPYRPNLYLGLRMRKQSSLMTGMMWYQGVDVSQARASLRHTCEGGEGIADYGWSAFDIRTGGIHTVNDTDNGIDLVAHFAKSSATDTNQRWELSLQGWRRADTQANQTVTFVFYIATEHPKSSLGCIEEIYMAHGKNSTSGVACGGVYPSQFDFQFHVDSNRVSAATDKTPDFIVHSLNIEETDLWMAEQIFLDQVGTRSEHKGYRQHEMRSGNLQFVQMSFVGNVDITIRFHSSTAPTTGPDPLLNANTETTEKSFDEQFLEVYEPRPPFCGGHYRSFSKYLLSNLMGGIGFFAGTGKVSNDTTMEKSSLDADDNAVIETGPHELFSAVPSRSHFPRGFLWDEGFHLQVIIDWDMDLAMTMLISWLGLMDDTGWIAREQILGPEARNHVPPKFQTQYRLYANPPTMFRVIEMFIDRITGATPYGGAKSRYMTSYLKDNSSKLSDAGYQFLQDVYPCLKKHYEWFKRTQAGRLDGYGKTPDGKLFTQGYRWRGRTKHHILTSGLDDYPRTLTLSEDDLHLDALCWVGLMNRVMHKISTVLAPPEVDRYQYLGDADGILAALENIHWSNIDQSFCDTTIDNTSQRQISYICHPGYVSLLPFLTGLLPPDHPYLPSILTLMESPQHLWSVHGLRSLGLSSPFYGTAENYWRGPIWLNFNYMALEQLLHLSQQRGPLAQRASWLYSQLRQNIVRTVFHGWMETGSAWEQYHPETGRGQRVRHFTGWTALAVRIMAMPDIEPSGPRAIKFLEVQTLSTGESSDSGHFILLLELLIMVVICFTVRRTLFRGCVA